jgi:hypothetical protein
VIVKFKRPGKEKNQIVVDMTADPERTYPTVTTDCRQMINDLQTFEVLPPPEAAPTPSAPSGAPGTGAPVDTLNPALRDAGAKGSGIAVPT